MFEVAGGFAEEVCAGRFGEAMGLLLFGAVDNLAGAGDADDTGEADRKLDSAWACGVGPGVRGLTACYSRFSTRLPET